jgi:phage-related protein
LATRWTFRDFQFSEDSNPIEDWYKSLSEEGRSEFDTLLKVNQKTDSPIQWIGFKRFLKGKKFERERIWELEFRADKRQYRVLGRFGQIRKQAIILLGCYHKGTVYTPADALEQAYKRAKLLAEGRALTCDRPIREDI